jgi:hypothetical protein
MEKSHDIFYWEEFFLDNNWIEKMCRLRKPTSKRMPAHFLNYSCPMDGLLPNDRLIFTNHMYSMDKSHNIFYGEGFFLENNWILYTFRPRKHNIFYWEGFFLENNLILYIFRPRKPPPLHRTRMLQDDDPYLVSNMAESILPLIPERNGAASTSSSRLHHPQGTQVGVVQYP